MKRYNIQNNQNWSNIYIRGYNLQWLYVFIFQINTVYLNDFFIVPNKAVAIDS